jgi:uncharacterized membrane protein
MTITTARIGWWLMLLGAALVVLASSRYFTMNPAVYFPRQRAVYEALTLPLMAHVGGMVFSALLGPFQFVRSIRTSWPLLHRMMGRVYLAGALVGGLSGLVLAFYAATGPRAGVGFGILALLVLATGTVAFRRILQGRVQSHREWMVRNYALIFAAVTLRLYQPFTETWFGEDLGYMMLAWISWIPNLLVAEWLIRGGMRARPEPARVRPA